MASDDELRAKMRAAIVERRDRYPRHPHDAPSHDVADAVIPVIREALADAWDEGWTAGYRAQDYDETTPSNPWRKDD